MGAARHQIITRTLGSGSSQHRGLDIEETVLFEVTAHLAGDCRTQLDTLLHQRAAQVDVAVAQADILTHAVVVNHERGCLRLVEYIHIIDQYLNATGRQLLVDGPLGALAHHTIDIEDILGTDMLANLEGLGMVGVEHDLSDTGTVTQVDKDHTTVITTTVDPAGQLNLFTNQRLVNLSTVVASHSFSLILQTVILKQGMHHRIHLWNRQGHPCCFRPYSSWHRS